MKKNERKRDEQQPRGVHGAEESGGCKDVRGCERGECNKHGYSQVA